MTYTLVEIIAMSTLFLLFTAVPTKRALHMFQQNRYELKRYTDWAVAAVQKMKSQQWVVVVLLIIALIMEYKFRTVVLKTFLILMMGTGILFQFYSEMKKEYIKPLVFTNRVKRQVGAFILLHFFWILWLLTGSTLQISLGMTIGYIGPWLLILGVHAITLPIEENIKKQFLTKAKKIVGEHKQLIKIGITGSYGKTTSKNIVQAILSERFYSLMTPASFNTPMGITITIREKLKPIHEVFVCEMGADHVGDIQELCDFVQPKIGLVTSIGPQHLNTFGNLENIIKEKMQLIEKLPPDGVGIINLDNEYIRNYQVQNTCRLVRYGIENKSGDYYAKEIEYSPKGSQFIVVAGEEEISFETKLLGEHNIANILSAIAIAKELGMDWKEIQRAVKLIDYVEHRLELKKIQGYTFIDNAFNSNPVGAAMSLQVLKMMPNKRFIITPGMIDLGSQQETLNKEFGKKMKGSADVVLLVGIEQTKPILDGLTEVGFNAEDIHVCKTVKEAFHLVYQLATFEDTILLENDLPDAFNY